MSPDRTVVTRACAVCEWERTAVETGNEAIDCEWCHAPTHILTEQPVESAAKNVHAAALGRLGGLKGGPARAARLSAKRRRDIARKAAEARWRRTK
jgi:hypothetical protein